MSTICSICGCPVDEGSGICPNCGAIVSGGAPFNQTPYGDPFTGPASDEDRQTDPVPADPPEDPIINDPDEDDLFEDEFSDEDEFLDEDDDDEPEPEPEPEPAPPPKPVDPPAPKPAPAPKPESAPPTPPKKKKKKGCCGCGCFLPLLVVILLSGFLVFSGIASEVLYELGIPVEINWDELPFELPFELPEALRIRGRFSSDDVPSSAVEFDGHYYYIFSEELYSYEDALRFCEERHGYLATITSDEENQFLYDYLTRLGYDHVFLGGSDAAEEGTWVWSNGEAFSYTNWREGEPNNDLDGESSMVMYYILTDGAWNDLAFAIPSPTYVDPVTAELSASSELRASKTYPVEWLADNDPTTAWNEGADGILGESVTFQFDNNYWLTGFEIQAGFQAGESTYYNNARPSVVELAFPDGTVFTCFLEDIMDVQYIEFPQLVFAQSVTMTILDAYPGERYEDTCITELRYTAQTGKVGFVCEWGEYLPEE